MSGEALKSTVLVAGVAMILLVVNALSPQKTVQADESRNRVVRLQAGSVSTEVCVLVVHRSQMHSNNPIARCLTKEEAERVLK